MNWSSIIETSNCPTNVAVVVLSVFYLRIYVLFSVTPVVNFNSKSAVNEEVITVCMTPSATTYTHDMKHMSSLVQG